MKVGPTAALPIVDRKGHATLCICGKKIAPCGKIGLGKVIAALQPHAVEGDGIVEGLDLIRLCRCAFDGECCSRGILRTVVSCRIGDGVLSGTIGREFAARDRISIFPERHFDRPDNTVGNGRPGTVKEHCIGQLIFYSCRSRLVKGCGEIDTEGAHFYLGRSRKRPAAVACHIGDGVCSFAVGREGAVRHGEGLAVAGDGIRPHNGRSVGCTFQRRRRDRIGNPDRAARQRPERDGILLLRHGDGDRTAFKTVIIAFKHKGVLVCLRPNDRDGGILIGDGVIRPLRKDGIAALDRQLVGKTLLGSDAEPGVEAGLPCLKLFARGVIH